MSKIGDLIFGVKADRGQLKVELQKLNYDFKKAGDDIEKSLGKNTLGGLEKRLGTLNSRLKELSIGSREFRSLQKEIKATETAIDKANGKTQIFSKGIKILGGVISTLSIYKLKEISDTFTNMQNRLKQVSSGDELIGLQKKLFDAANSSRTAVDTYTSAFVRFDLVNKELGGTQEETLTIMDSLTKGLSASGAEGAEVTSVMLQLAQAFGSGQLSGDEFRAVSEAMPGLLTILAEQLGVSRGALKDLAAEGLITSDVLKNALLASNESLNESFNKSSKTIGQVMTIATNNFIKKFGELDKTYEITEKLVKGIEAISGALLAGVDFVIKYGSAIKELTIVVIALISANALFGLATILRGLPAILGSATIATRTYAAANAILTGALARLGIASTTALGPLGALAAAIWAAIYAYRELRNVQDINSRAESNRNNVTASIGDSVSETAREVQRLQKENEKLYKDGSKEAKAQIELNKNKLKLEQQSLKTQGLIQQKQLLINKGKNKEAEDLQGAINLEMQYTNELRDQYGVVKKMGEIDQVDVDLKIDTLDFSGAGGGGGSGGAEEKIKTAEEIEKEILEAKEEALKKENDLIKEGYEMYQKREEYLEDLREKEQEKLKDRVEFISDTIEQITDIYDEELEKSSDNIDDYIKDIEKLQETLLDLEEESKKIAENFFDFGNSSDQKKMERYLETYGDTLTSIGNDAILGEGVTAGDLRDFQDLKAEQQKNENDKLIAENELVLLQEKKLKEEELFSEFASKRAAIDENYRQVRESIEVQITDTVYQEALKQESYQNKLIEKWRQVAAERRSAMGIDASESSSSSEGFFEGGYTGDGPVTGKAGDVHYKEYVIPHDIVKKVPETISQLESMRQGNQSFDNSKHINVPSMIVQNQVDAELFFDKLKFKL